MSVRRRVVLVGAYGIRNAGDDAPLLVLTRALRGLHPDVDFEFTVVARHDDPELMRQAGARFLQNPEYPSREAARGRGFRGLNPGDDRAGLERLDRAIRDADLVVAGAGNVLIDLAIDLFRGPVPLLALYAFLADLHATPTMLFGVSAGPLRTPKGRELAAWIARRAAAVTVRDEASRALLGRLAPGVEATLLPDPVLGLEPADDARFLRALEDEGIPRVGARPRLALALRDLGFMGLGRDRILAALRRLAPGRELLFVPQCTDHDCDDRLEAEVLARALPEAHVHVVRGRHAPDVLMRFYETAAATLAVRLHGAVFSAMAGTPVVGLAYLPKVRGFLERVGAGEACFEPSRVTADELVAAVERAERDSRAALALRTHELSAGVREYALRASALMGLPVATAEAA